MTTPYERLAREIERLGDERAAIANELDEAKAQAEGMGEFAAQAMAECNTAKAALEELREAVRDYLAVDGSEGNWEAVKADLARDRLRALLEGGGS